MKKIFNSNSIYIVVACVLVMAGCKKDEPTVAEITQKKLIAHAWVLKNANVDGTDKTSVYAGLTITFTTLGYTATNVSPSWKTSGTWKFTDDKATKIVRDDGLEITIAELSEEVLKMSYTWNTGTFKAGRIGSVKGNHTLTLGK